MHTDTEDEDVPPLPPPMPSLEELRKAQSNNSCEGMYILYMLLTIPISHLLLLH